jgi:hypothetical protein
MKKSLSMKKLYILTAGFLMERYDKLEGGEKAKKVIKKRELPYLKDFLQYIFKNKDKI